MLIPITAIRAKQRRKTESTEDMVQGVSSTGKRSCPAGTWKGLPEAYVKAKAEDNDVGVIPTEEKAEITRG